MRVTAHLHWACAFIEILLICTTKVKAEDPFAAIRAELERKLKKEAAETEPAWTGAGEEVGLQIWRIEKFKVTDWPQEEYGKFYKGDSYIVLNTYRKNDTLLHDVHFWIGSESSQDEYTTAATKAAELDTFLNDTAEQHREVMGQESDLFKSYFPSITLLEGGVESGLRQTQEEVYPTRLLQVSGTNSNITIQEVCIDTQEFQEQVQHPPSSVVKFPLQEFSFHIQELLPLAIPHNKLYVTQNDVFILDQGLDIYRYDGANANNDEKFRGIRYVQVLTSERDGKPRVTVVDGADTPASNTFLSKLDDPPPAVVKPEGPIALFKVSDEDGSLGTEFVKAGGVTMDDLDSKDVFLVDFVSRLFVWVGSDASADERGEVETYVRNYRLTTDHPSMPWEIVPDNDIGNNRLRQALAA